MDAIPYADVIIGGPPCQSFSLVGKRLQDDPRGKLVLAYQQVIERIRPKAFVMENVPGLTASRVDGVRLHHHLAEQFERMGYHMTLLKLIATDFFVPQRRSRMLMVGHRLGNRPFSLISQEAYATLLGTPLLQAPVSVADALDDLPPPAAKGCHEAQPYRRNPHSTYAQLMRRDATNDVTLQSMPTMSVLDREFVRHIPPGGNYNDIPDHIATKRILSFKASGGRTTTYGRLDPALPAYTINTYFNRPNVGANYHHRDERLITVREALRLQSFPDDFTPFFSSQRSLHAQVGNAVPPLMSRAIAESLRVLFQ